MNNDHIGDIDLTLTRSELVLLLAVAFLSLVIFVGGLVYIWPSSLITSHTTHTGTEVRENGRLLFTIDGLSQQVTLAPGLTMTEVSASLERHLAGQESQTRPVLVQP